MIGVERHIIGADDAGIRLDRWFKRHMPELGHGQLEKLLRTGQIRLDGARVKAGARVVAGQEIRVPPVNTAPDRPQKKPVPKLSREDKKHFQSLVLTETSTFVAINKPAGLAVQGGTGTPRHLDRLLAGLAEETGERLRLVHRLDRDTSGVLLLAKSANSASFFVKSFKEHRIAKTYWALTAGVPHPRRGRIDLALVKRVADGREGRETMQPADLVRSGERGAGRAREARTDYEVLGDARKVAWVALRPLTGRTHQLRAHLAALGAPILGDRKYGGERAQIGGAMPQGLMLHACALTLLDPEGRSHTITAPPPPPMQAAFELLGFAPEDAAAWRSS